MGLEIRWFSACRERWGVMGSSIFSPPFSANGHFNWSSRRLASLGVFSKGRGGSKEDDADTGVPCIRYGDLYTTYETVIRQVRRRVAPTIAGEYTALRKGDIVFAASGESIADIGKCAVSLSSGPVVCGGDTLILRPNSDVNSMFMAYALNAQPYRKLISQRATGTIIIHISVGKLKDIRVALPSVAEQAAIVKYLAHANARIDKAITAKRRLIALLEEQCRAIVSEQF
ncbi:MAG: restriction endonuclease subunit S, partial [Angustibacter sp.]